MTVLREGRPPDESALLALQSHLAEPSPALLRHGLRTGSVVVSVPDDPEETSGRVARAPVGYVLPVVGDDVHVAELVVDPAYRREGRARRLLARVLASTDRRVTLLVHPDNDGARTLYDEVGFERVGRRPGFYDDADALVMAHDGE
ncbi:GNAT family N-acetyltransferase [Halobaculum sp. MBLA0147]|uniref:GNAT family N-acetyltransferase n=1 Tax=Halobaculum sp. MBLA0147 TaxID=3079934 RepID=UPI00352579F1